MVSAWLRAGIRRITELIVSQYEHRIARQAKTRLGRKQATLLPIRDQGQFGIWRLDHDGPQTSLRVCGPSALVALSRPKKISTLRPFTTPQQRFTHLVQKHTEMEQTGLGPNVIAKTDNWIALDWIHGVSLASAAKQNPQVIWQAVAALMKLHEHGIVHGDSHIGNILIDGNNIKFIDLEEQYNKNISLSDQMALDMALLLGSWAAEGHADQIHDLLQTLPAPQRHAVKAQAQRYAGDHRALRRLVASQPNGKPDPSTTIAVVIPTFDRTELLHEALQSVMNQTVSPTEVWVVDAHPDQTATSTCATFPDTRHVDGRTCPTVGASRNLGATQATTEVVAFLDDDDLWEPKYLETALRAMADAPMVLTAFNNQRGNEILPGKTPPPPGRPRDWFLRNPGATGSNLVILRSVFDSLGGFDAELPVSEDKDFALRALQAGVQWEAIEAPLVRRRIHTGHLSAPNDPRLPRGLLLFGRKHRRIATPLQKFQYSGRLHQAQSHSAPNSVLRLYHRLAALVRGNSAAWQRLLRRGVDPLQRKENSE